MLNQGQGTYPQLAGSFFNSAQMTPHDNGRNAKQVPTFFGGLQNMMSASSAMTNYQGIPLSQSILSTQALASHQYGQSMGNVLSGLGTGLGVAGLVGGAGVAASGIPGLGFLGTGVLGKGLALAGGLPVMAAGLGVMASVSAYKKRMAEIEDMRNALQGSRMGYGLADPITGNISNTAALQLSRNIQYSASGSGFKDKDLRNVMGQASALGMLNGMQSLGEVTKRVTDLAKASREIVMLGEGISMSDAMQLQKLTQDMGISTSKFRGMGIGKNLVMAARAASMSMDEAAQIGGQGAMTFQQVGLGAASGMNAAFFTSTAARGLTGAGAFSQRQLAALGGERGIAQSLLAGQAGTMARLSDTMVMGAVKLGGDGQFRIDRDMLDRYVRGEVSVKDMANRAKNIGKDMTKGQRARLMEGLQFAMPELKEQMSDMLTSEEMMTVQGREILNLQRRTGLSTRRAAQAYFGDAAQAEAFLGYASNFGAARAEADRQRRIADQERTLKYAGMAKSSSTMARLGRSIVHGAETVGDALAYIPTFIGEGLATRVTKLQDDRNRGMQRIMGLQGDYSGLSMDVGARIYGGTSGGARGEHILAYDSDDITDRHLIHGRYENFQEMASDLLYRSEDVRSSDIDRFLSKINQTGLNDFLGEGLGEKLTRLEEGEYSVLRKAGDLLGIEDISDERRRNMLMRASYYVDSSIKMGQLMEGNNRFSMENSGMRRGYNRALAYLRDVSIKAAEGDGSGYAGGVHAGDINYNIMQEVVQGAGVDRETADAVIAEAYRYAKGASGKFGRGFNKMLTATAELVGMFNVEGTGPAQKLDSLRLRSGGFIEAAGLSEALAGSTMSQQDVAKLVRALSTNRKGLLNEGAGRDSTEAILRRAGISRSRYKGRMGSVRKVIDALMKGQITVGDKTYGLEEAENEGISTLLDSRAITGAIDADTRRRLEALDLEIGRNLDDGGENLRKDLYSSITFSSRNRGDVMRALITEDDVQTKQEELAGDALAKMYSRKDMLESQIKKLKRTGHSSSIMNKLAEKEAELKELNFEIGEAESDTSRKFSLSFRDAARDALIDKAMRGDVDADMARATRDRQTLLSGTGTLSEALQNLADRRGTTDEDKESRRKAYAKLMQGIGGEELEMEFSVMRSKLKGVRDPQKRREMELKMMEKIIEKARTLGVDVPGAQQKSKALPDILAQIAGGVTQFTKTMENIATLTASGGTLEIHGPTKGTTGKAEK